MDIIKKYFSDFTAVQEKQFDGLQAQYELWNSQINVISRKDMEQFYLHHVLHSLAIAAQFELKAGMKVMDLGCGGGFPGVPLAILFPEVEFLLVDSINKKLKVVNEVCAALEIKNVITQHSRAENITPRSIDLVVSRAVAPLKDLWTWSKVVLRKYPGVDEQTPNGLICLKGGDLTQEIFESGCKPFVWEMQNIFDETYFKEKFLLYVKK